MFEPGSHGRDRYGSLPLEFDSWIVATRVSSEVLCTTPCVIDGPPGTYRLGFPFNGGGGFDMAEVQILTEPTVYRRSLGTRRGSGGALALGIVSTSFGGMSLACGAGFLAIGLSRDVGEGGGFVIGGAVSLIGGAMLFLHSHGTHPSARMIAFHHSVMGTMAVLAGLCKITAGTKAQVGRSPWGLAWSALVLLIGVELLVYTE